MLVESKVCLSNVLWGLGEAGGGGGGWGACSGFLLVHGFRVKTAPFVIDIIMIEYSGLAKFASQGPQGRLSALVQYHSLTGIVQANLPIEDRYEMSIDQCVAA